MDSIKISGHRGYRAKEIENTRTAFERAIEEKLDYVELDIRKTQDGAPVIFHDKKINRLLNGKGSIEELTLEELRSFRYEDGQQILTLQELFQLAGRKIKMILDVKSNDIEQQIIHLIEKNSLEDDVIIQSINGECIKKFNDHAPDLNYCLYRSFLGKAFLPHSFFASKFYNKLVEPYQIKYLSLDGPFMYHEFIKIASENGLKIILGSIRTESYLKKLKKWNIDIINADDPGRIRELILELNL